LLSAFVGDYDAPFGDLMSIDSQSHSSVSGRETGGDDVALMLGLGSQDPGALAALYDRYGRIVFTLAARILRDDRESEEVTQDVFLALWKNPGAYRPDRASPLTWLAGITRNKCIDRMRKAGRRLPLHFSGNEERDVVVEDRATDPYESVAVSDLSGYVRECLERLPEPQREAVEFVYFECLSTDQIADRFELPRNTIKSRIRLAMDKLRRCLRHKCDE
jgi:RNA polymerase sigma-70 factor, ECF subfamily